MIINIKKKKKGHILKCRDLTGYEAYVILVICIVNSTTYNIFLCGDKLEVPSCVKYRTEGQYEYSEDVLKNTTGVNIFQNSFKRFPSH